MVGTVFKSCDGQLLPLPLGSIAGGSSPFPALRSLDVDNCCFCAISKRFRLDDSFRYTRRECCNESAKWHRHELHHHVLDSHRNHLVEYDDVKDDENEGEDAGSGGDDRRIEDWKCRACRWRKIMNNDDMDDGGHADDFDSDIHYDPLVIDTMIRLLDDMPNLEHLDISGMHLPSPNAISLLKIKITFLKKNNNSALKYLRFSPNHHFTTEAQVAFETFHPDVTVLNDSTFSQSIRQLKEFTWPDVRKIPNFHHLLLPVDGSTERVRMLFEASCDTLDQYGYHWQIFAICTYGIQHLVLHSRYLLEKAGIGIERMFDVLRFKVLKRHFSEDLNMRHVLQIIIAYGSDAPVDVFKTVLTNLSKRCRGIDYAVESVIQIAKCSPQHKDALVSAVSMGELCPSPRAEWIIGEFFAFYVNSKNH